MGYSNAMIGYVTPPWDVFVKTAMAYEPLRNMINQIATTHVLYGVGLAAEGGFEECCVLLVDEALSNVRGYQYCWSGERSLEPDEVWDVSKGNGSWTIRESSYKFDCHDRPEVVRAIREEFARRGIASDLEPFVVSV